MSDMQTTDQLVDIIRQRAAVGLKKYGVSLDRTDLQASDWLRHLLEELCDAAGYVLAAERVQKETETAILAAIEMLRAGDGDSALAILKSCLPGDDCDEEPVVLVRDAGGA